MSTAPTLREEHRHFGGATRFYSHASDACAGEMRFSVFHPPQAESGPVPVLTYLSGLTCTEENFTVKAGAQRVAAELGLMIVAPDTSPRDTGIAGEDETWDFGSGAGFYCDATQAPWSAHYQMYSYVTQELPAFITEHFPADEERQGIFGHSMGGHGALIAALRNPDLYRSCSAFAPICNPTRSEVGQKAFAGYLGPDEAAWRAYDACELVLGAARDDLTVLVDQGSGDEFKDSLLLPDAFVAACKAGGQKLEFRLQNGYDHSYYFISSFIEDHLRHHAAVLGA
jgi:S-formylglutathione hydrolase